MSPRTLSMPVASMYGAAQRDRDTALRPPEAVGIVLVLVPLLVRASVGMTTLPYWDMDPLIFPLPMTGLGPAGSMLVDALVLLGAGLLLWAQHARRRRLNFTALGLAVAGSIPILFHAFANGGSLHDQRIGFSWLSGIFAGLAVAHAAREPVVRRVLAAVLLGCVALLALRSLEQVYIEHPRSMADFRTSSAETFAAHGWAPGSPSALAFERRLSQPEASGWFGLSNVLATFAAGLAVAAISLAWQAWRRRSSDASLAGKLALTLIAAAGITCLYLAHGKGGWLGFVMGIAALLLLTLHSRRRSTSPLLARLRTLALAIPTMAIIAAVALVALRGLVGERLSELSLLFRWFYAQGATSIFASHPLLGVGPDGFQTAYALAKPALSTEDVISAHAVVYDWPATLGVLGFAWIGLLFMAAVSAGKSALTEPVPAEVAAPTRNEYRLALAIAALATLLASLAELELRSPELALVRAGGLVLWGICTWAVVRAATDSSVLRLAMGAAAVSLLAHAQIDVAASFPPSASLFLTVIGLCAAPPLSAGPARGRTPLLAAAALVPIGLAVAVMACQLKAARWEAALKAAAEHVRPFAELGLRVRLSSDPRQVALDPTLAPAAVLADLSRAAGRSVPPTADGVRIAMTDLELAALRLASQALTRAYEIQPADRRVLRESTRLLMRSAELLQGRGQTSQARAIADKAIQAWGVDPLTFASRPGTTAADFRWAAALYERRGITFIDRADMSAALGLAGAALIPDPHNLEHALRAFRLANQIGDPSTPDWARRCLELDALQRLDSAVKGLSPADRQQIDQALAATPSDTQTRPPSSGTTPPPEPTPKP